MALHGSASGPLVWYRLGANSAARTSSMRASASDPSGFRHFLGDPAPADRFTIDGVPYDPAIAAQRARGQELMRRLALRLEREPPPPGGSFDNPNIPSGYTYFFQLVAHDLVHSTAFLSLSEGRLATIANTRSAPLRLETIFAEGPAARPELYERKTEKSRFHPVLRVGPLREDGSLPIGGKPTLRDETAGHRPRRLPVLECTPRHRTARGHHWRCPQRRSSFAVAIGHAFSLRAQHHPRQHRSPTDPPLPAVLSTRITSISSARARQPRWSTATSSARIF